MDENMQITIITYERHFKVATCQPECPQIWNTLCCWWCTKCTTNYIDWCRFSAIGNCLPFKGVIAIISCHYYHHHHLRHYYMGHLTLFVKQIGRWFIYSGESNIDWVWLCKKGFFSSFCSAVGKDIRLTSQRLPPSKGQFSLIVLTIFHILSQDFNKNMTRNVTSTNW